MEIGNKIKNLRSAKGITQETLAGALKVSSQAVSKWETGQSTPDIQLLPEIAVYFGVTIDELFSLTDDKEYDRIQNMLWDERDIRQEEADRAERWLTAKIKEGYRPADCWEMLASLYNQRADRFREKAGEFAREALKVEPSQRWAYAELNTAMGGYTPDWCMRNHHKLIDLLKAHLAEHPESWRGWMWLMDNLMDDYRFDEAREAHKMLAKVDDTRRTPLYAGYIEWYSGNRAKAWEIWRKMEERFPDDWMVCLALGDVKAMEGSYDEAAAYFKRAVEIQQPPRFTDGCISLAHVREMQGRYAEAIEAIEWQLRITDEDYDCRSGETVDQLHREIRRLRSLVEKDSKV